MKKTKSPGMVDKVAFLSMPAAYPDHVQHVETKQTHMSWVFLTETHAWKLKKPVRTDYLDFSTIESRRRDCVREVRLNRRLAGNVYRGVVPLIMTPEGGFRLGGQGKAVDWLVCMRRLPSARMLDDLIARRAVTEEDVSNIASLLAAFYKRARRVPLTGAQYRERLAADLDNARIELTKEQYGLDTHRVDSLVLAQLKFLQEHPGLFDARSQAGKIIDAHGDLRPEHICLEPEPVIIDCLEFNKSLRILDAASELVFLGLECERLGAPEIGDRLLRKYGECTGDHPSCELLAFYRAYHSCIRAKVAVWHLKDDGILNREEWIAKANRYLDLATDLRRRDLRL